MTAPPMTEQKVIVQHVNHSIENPAKTEEPPAMTALPANHLVVTTVHLANHLAVTTVHLAHHAKAVMSTVLSADRMAENPAKAAIHVHLEKKTVQHVNHLIEKIGLHVLPAKTAKTEPHAVKTAKKGHSVSREDYLSQDLPINQSVSGLTKAIYLQ